MLRIAICDDMENSVHEVKGYISEVCEKLNIQTEITAYYSGEELCKSLESGTHYDIVFLDIEMGSMSGIEVGAKIRDTYNKEFLQIVYISAESNYALELFDINPLNFLIKPLDYGKIEKVINKYLKISGLWTDVFTYKYGHDYFKVEFKNIKYFKSNGRKVVIIKADNTNEDFYGSLEKIYNEQLNKYDFLFIHKSYIVNYDFVSVFEYERLILTDKTELPIGQSKRKEIRNRQSEIDNRRI